MRIFVTGATGFVGRALVPRLLEAGHEVVAATRDPDAYDGPGQPVRVDLDHVDAIPEGLAGCDAAFYLVHSLDRGGYQERDARLARNFAQAASGVEKVVYLGGLGARGEGSEHLRSRHEVGDILAEALPTVEVRAAMVLGKGSASYELLRQLVDRLAVLVVGELPVPRAMGTLTQPVGLDQAVTSLVAALALEPGQYDIGVRQPVSFARLMEQQADACGKSLRLDPILPIAPEFFSPLAALVTDQDGMTILALFGSAGTPTVVDENRRLPGDTDVQELQGVLDDLAARTSTS